MLPPSLPVLVKPEDQNGLFAEELINFSPLTHAYLYSSTNKEENENSLDIASTLSLLQQTHSV